MIVTAPDMDIVMSILERELLNNNSIVIDVEVRRNMTQRLKIDMTLNEEFNVYKFKPIMEKAIDVINQRYYSSGKCVFSTYYKYTYTSRSSPDEGERSGVGYTGNSDAFEDRNPPPPIDDESPAKGEWTQEHMVKELVRLQTELEKIGVTLPADWSVVIAGSGCSAYARINNRADLIEFCYRAFNELTEKDRLSVLWHEVFHVLNDVSVDLEKKRKVIPTFIITNIPKDILEYMKEFAQYSYRGLDYPQVDKDIASYWNAYLYVETIRHPSFYENEVKAYKAEIERMTDVSYYYEIERKVMLWIMEQHLIISKRVWRE